MMDLVPNMIDGAVVLNLQNCCHVRANNCEACTQLVLNTHNWLKHAELDYAVFDFLDEKEICPTFLEELLLLRKRMRCPFLFAGVMDKARDYLEGYSHREAYPLFVTPEDAVRALRIQHPGITESPIKIPVKFGMPLMHLWKQSLGEAFGAL